MKIPQQTSSRLLSSVRAGEDAGVYLLAEDLAMIQTVDFFPPVVDDPLTFGRIAAANALSDIYAMGGQAITALNIVCFPHDMDFEILERILLGGHQKALEAGALIIGGHTIDDEEPKYGLAVTGLVNPSRMKKVVGSIPGDALVLTKRIGTGILTTALKGELVTERDIDEAIESMSRLNKGASEVLSRPEVHAMTDVTGFGLVGHLLDLIRPSHLAAEIWVDRVPLFDLTAEMASMGVMPGGLHRNREYARDLEVNADGLDDLSIECLHDPQTSGGLLASVDSSRAGEILTELRQGPAPNATMIGRLEENDVTRVIYRKDKKES